jgi:hypothetical protein
LAVARFLPFTFALNALQIGERVQSDAGKVDNVSASMLSTGSNRKPCRSSRLTYTLRKGVQGAIGEPDWSHVIVALDINPVYIVVLEDGSRNGVLRSAYLNLAGNDNLSNILNKKVFTVLDLYKGASNFMVTENGGCNDSVIFDNKEEGDNRQEIEDTYMHLGAKRDKSSSTNSIMLNDLQMRVKITLSSGALCSIGEDLVAIPHASQFLRGHPRLVIVGAVASGVVITAEVTWLPSMILASLAAAKGFGTVPSRMFSLSLFRSSSTLVSFALFVGS